MDITVELTSYILIWNYAKYSLPPLKWTERLLELNECLLKVPWLSGSVVLAVLLCLLREKVGSDSLPPFVHVYFPNYFYW